MNETYLRQACSSRPLSSARSIMVGIAILLLIVGVGSVTAGVIIQQRITVGTLGEPASVRNRTLMLQDDKERFEVKDGVSIVIDANYRTVTMIDDKHKIFREVALGKIIGTPLDPDGRLYLGFTTTDKTRKLLGFKCRDYTGARYHGPLMEVTTACFSTDAPNSEEFSHLVQSMVQHAGPAGASISVPSGVPLIIESTSGVNPSFVLPDASKEEAERFRSRLAKIPPQVTRVEVTKIESKQLLPEVFNIPTGYSRRGPEVN